MNPDVQALVRDNSGGTSGWEKLWASQITPWDLGGVTPAIEDLLKAGRIPRGRVLVPGCGRGYDPMAIAGTGQNTVVGLDLSETGIAAANEERLKRQIPSDTMSFILGDFFAYKPDQPFDAIFDYTFLCALLPSLRKSWAQKMAELVRPGTGLLICMMFPLSDHESGPPFALSIDIYRQLLVDGDGDASGSGAFEEVSIEDCRSAPSREGKEKLGIFRRKST